MASLSKAPEHVFRPGELIPRSGMYTIIHDGHGQLQTVDLVKDLHFPSCPECGDRVEYESTLEFLTRSPGDQED
jgi:hypothetical protein